MFELPAVLKTVRELRPRFQRHNVIDVHRLFVDHRSAAVGKNESLVAAIRVGALRSNHARRQAKTLGHQSRQIVASPASQSCAAVFATMSSTGWMSVGELAMTPKISLVAVCCSRGRRSSELIEQPHVLDGYHGLIGEGFKQSWICLSVKGCTFSRRPMVYHTNQHAFFKQRYG